MVKVLSLDTSTKKTGYALFNHAGLVKSGVIIADSTDGVARISQMVEHIYDLLDTVNPDYVVFEDVKVLNNQKILVMLSEILGAVIGWCVEHHILYTSLTPSEWRSTVGIQQTGIKRDEFKRRSVDKVREFYNKVVTDDEADSICIGSAFLMRRNKG